MTSRDWRIASLLFLLISSAYFATGAGITSSNDGSHYALVRAIVDKHSFEISDYLEYTEQQDYAFLGDQKFSDRPPGTAFVTAPFYAASAFLPPPLTKLASKHDADNPRLIYVLIVPVLTASLAAVALFWLLRAHFNLSEGVSVLTTLAFAFGTMTWKYGSLLYSHATSGILVILIIVILLKHFRDAADSPSAKFDFWLGVLLGTTVLMDYTNIVFLGFVGIWYLWQLKTWPQRVKSALLLALGGLIPGAILMGYNTLNFGGPFELSTFHVDTTRWPQNTSFLHDFATPIWVGLPAMLFWGSDNQGFFWLAPISLLGLLGLVPLWRKSRHDSFLIVGSFMAMLLLFSTSTTFNPATNDGRYLAPFLGLWFVVVAFGIQYAQDRFGAVAPPLTYGLFFLSLYNQILHIAYAWGHDLSPSVMQPWAMAPDNVIALWKAVLPNVGNVPLWWGILLVAWFPILALYRTLFRGQAATPVQPASQPQPGD